jgi:hypothetical protein
MNNKQSTAGMIIAKAKHQQKKQSCLINAEAIAHHMQMAEDAVEAMGDKVDDIARVNGMEKERVKQILKRFFYTGMRKRRINSIGPEVSRQLRLKTLNGGGGSDL